MNFRCEYISVPAHCLDQTGTARIDLDFSAQAAHLVVDAAIKKLGERLAVRSKSWSRVRTTFGRCTSTSNRRNSAVLRGMDTESAPCNSRFSKSNTHDSNFTFFDFSPECLGGN